MIRIYGVILFFLFYLFVSNAQEKKFDSIYRITVKEVIYSDPIEAIENVDFLISISTNNESKIRALFLKSEIFRMAGLHTEAIRFLYSADSLIDPSNHNQLLLLHGLLATNYRERKSPVASQKHLQEAQKIVMNITDEQERYKLLSNIHQEISYVHTEQKEYQKAIENIHKSLGFLKKIDSTKMDRKFGWALNYQILGENFLKLHDTDSSIVYFNKALLELEKSLIPNSALKGFILNGLAKNMMLKNEYDKVEELFDKTEIIANVSQNKALLKDLYNSKTSFYKEIGDSEKYILANEHYLALLDEEKSFEKGLNESLIQYFKQQSIPEAKKKNNFLRLKFLLPSVLIFSILLITIKKNRAKPTTMTEEAITVQNDKTSEHTNKEYMSEETMDAIVEKLKELESKKFYLEKNLSLASVAAEVGVNHRYLSYTIRQKMEKDFTTYINDLRIDYIIDFLKEDTKHLHYKISYLAEISGFSSHNRFSIIFKKSKGISPSELIQQLQEQQESINE